MKPRIRTLFFLASLRAVLSYADTPPQQAPPEKPSCSQGESLIDGKCVKKEHKTPSISAQAGPETPTAGDGQVRPSIPRCHANQTLKDGECVDRRPARH
jgi:hypothetical protein